MTVQDIYSLINSVSPFDTQMDGDNSGLLVGSPAAEVSGVLFALDCTQAVISEAVEQGANLIVTHHPLMFSPRRDLTDRDYEGRLLRRLVRENIALIAAHTNLDRADGGINDALAEICGLQDVSGRDYVRVGCLPEPRLASDLASDLASRLNTTVRLLGPENAVVTRLGLCSGAGGSEWETALELGCDGFLSGEIKHHFALALADQCVPAFECGHFATELPGILALADALQNALDTVECNLRIFKSVQDNCTFPPQP